MRIFAALIGLPGYYDTFPFTFFHEERLIALQFYAAKHWLARVPFHFHIHEIQGLSFAYSYSRHLRHIHGRYSDDRASSRP